MSKPAKSVRTRSKTRSAASNGSQRRKSQQRKKAARKEPTANELMLEAWKKLYEARRDRLV
jgi:hypothetical protein